MLSATLLGLLLLCATGAGAGAGTAESKVEQFAARAAALEAPGPETLAELGRSLRGTPYLKGTLQGQRHAATGLVLSLSKVDCMVFLEWLLAGNSLAGHPDADADSLAFALRRVRFQNDHATWQERHHFFSDWLSSGPELMDAGRSFVGAEQRRVNLNCRPKGARWVRGLPCREVEVWWVPPGQSTLDSLRTGDMIGLWAAKPGLDVTHVGLILKEDDGRATLLDASSRFMKVVEEPLDKHPAWKRGLLVFRLPESK